MGRDATVALVQARRGSRVVKLPFGSCCEDVQSFVYRLVVVLSLHRTMWTLLVRALQRPVRWMAQDTLYLLA